MLEGSRLFHDLCKQNPRRFSPGKILNLHQDVERTVRSRLRQKGGPVLKPIDAQALTREEYIQAFVRYTRADPQGLDFDRYGSFVFTAMMDGALRWKVFYDVAALKKAAEEKGIAAGRAMVHEIAGAVYGALAEDDLRAGGFVDDDRGIDLSQMPEEQREMMLAGEGWACFFQNSRLIF